MSYYDSLNAEQKKNISIIIDEANKAGITNPNTIAGMLAIVSKESAFKPQSENMNYDVAGLQRVFGLSSDRANQLAGKPEEIGNAVYGGKYGNAFNEGYKYRGRGFNQLTFKKNYEKYGRLIGEDLVSNPDKVNDVRTAAKILVQYNKEGIKTLKNLGKLQSYNANDINDFKNTTDSTMAFYHATAGAGKDVAYVKSLTNPANDSLKGMTKALSRVNDLLVSATSYVKKNHIPIILVTAIIIISGYVLYTQLKSKNK